MAYEQAFEGGAFVLEALGLAGLRSSLAERSRIGALLGGAGLGADDARRVEGCVRKGLAADPAAAATAHRPNQRSEPRADSASTHLSQALVTRRFFAGGPSACVVSACIIA